MRTIAAAILIEGMAFGGWRLQTTTPFLDLRTQITPTAFVGDRDGNFYVAGNTNASNLPRNTLRERVTSPRFFVLRDGIQSGIRLPESPERIVFWTADQRRPGVWFVCTFTSPNRQALWRTADAGETWELLGNGLPIPLFYGSLEQDPSQDGVFYLVAVNAALPTLGAVYQIYRTGNSGKNWEQWHSRAAEIRGIVIDPFDSSHMFAYDGRPLRSIDGGRSWAVYGDSGGPPMFDAVQRGVLYAWRGATLRVSTDAGATWSTASAPPGLRTGPTTAFPDPRGGVLAYSNSVLYRSADLGQTWTSSATPGNVAPVGLAARHGLLFAADSVGVVYRSRDWGATWDRVPGTALSPLAGTPLVAPNSSNPAGDPELILERAPAASDGFLLKLDSRGQLLWSTFLGGSGNDTIHALALDPEGNPVVAGATGSADFPRTPGTFSYGETLTKTSGFYAKISAQGDRVLWSAALSGHPAASVLAIDAAGSLYAAGTAPPGLQTSPGAVQPDFIAAAEGGPTALNLFATRIADGASQVLAVTYVGGVTGPRQAGAQARVNSILADNRGDIYLTGINVAGTGIWKLDPALSRVLAYRPPGLSIMKTVLSAGRIYLTGGAGDGCLMRAGASVAGILAGLDKDTFEVASCFDLRVAASQLAVGSDGRLLAAGATSSYELPTRSLLQGNTSPSFGLAGNFITLAPVPGGEIDLSTYTPSFVLATLDSDGNPVLLTSRPNLVTLIPDDSSPVRIDRIRSPVTGTGTPIAARQRVLISGVGFEPDSRVLCGTQEAAILTRSTSEIWALLPAQFDGTILVESGGARSNRIPMPQSPGPLAIHLDGITNPDGTTNSAENPAPIGSVITVAVEGLWPDQEISAWATGVPSEEPVIVRADLARIPGETWGVRLHVQDRLFGSIRTGTVYVGLRSALGNSASAIVHLKP